MIIIEGADKTGKTALAQALASQLPEWKPAHFGVPKGSVVEYHLDGIEAVGSKSIVDRLHWSEYAYGLTYRGVCGYDEVAWDGFEEMLVGMNATVILMTDSVDRIQKRWRAGGEPFDVEKVMELVNHFEDLVDGTGFRRSRLWAVRFNYRDLFHPDGTEMVYKIKDLADHERRKF